MAHLSEQRLRHGQCDCERRTADLRYGNGSSGEKFDICACGGGRLAQSVWAERRVGSADWAECGALWRRPPRSRRRWRKRNAAIAAAAWTRTLTSTSRGVASRRVASCKMCPQKRAKNTFALFLCALYFAAIANQCRHRAVPPPPPPLPLPLPRSHHIGALAIVWQKISINPIVRATADSI